MNFLKLHWGKLLIGGVLLCGGVAADVALQPDPITVKLENPQQIVWTKPTTDAGWAEDVKAESFDLKSSDVLQQMLVDQKQGLNVASSSFSVYTDCPECVKYNLKQANPTWTPTDVDNEFVNEFNQHQWLVEKIAQSIERIEHELDLRVRGVVVPDKIDKKGTKAKTSDLQKVIPSMVRHVND